MKYKPMVGKQFGRLLITKFAYVDWHGNAFWFCNCGCGKENHIARGSSLRSGTIQSCGCLQSNPREMIGRTFNRLTVISFCGSNSKRCYVFECQCVCGQTCKVSGIDLRSGNTKSCGCLHSETAGKVFLTHGGTGTRLHCIWKDMIQRCGNDQNPAFPRYGGRGIRVCPEWRHDFPAFRDWALSHGYAENLTIDRKDNDGNYEPGNCQWITREENSHLAMTVRWSGRIPA